MEQDFFPRFFFLNCPPKPDEEGDNDIQTKRTKPTMPLVELQIYSGFK